MVDCESWSWLAWTLWKAFHFGGKEEFIPLRVASFVGGMGGESRSGFVGGSCDGVVQSSQ